jgi:hypothetical protein
MADSPGAGLSERLEWEVQELKTKTQFLKNAVVPKCEFLEYQKLSPPPQNFVVKIIR